MRWAKDDLKKLCSVCSVQTKPKELASLCNAQHRLGVEQETLKFDFRVGHLLLTESAAERDVAKRFTDVGIVMEAPETHQTAENVKVVIRSPEGLIEKHSLAEIAAQSTGLLILPVDERRFPKFYKRAEEIEDFLNAQVGKRFDPASRSVFSKWTPTRGHFSSSSKSRAKVAPLEQFGPGGHGPSCSERLQTFSSYKESLKGVELEHSPSRGWRPSAFSGNLAAWTLAFAGGLNRDYGKPPAAEKARCSRELDLADWVIKDLDPPVKDLRNKLSVWGREVYLRCVHDHPYIETASETENKNIRTINAIDESGRPRWNIDVVVPAGEPDPVIVERNPDGRTWAPSRAAEADEAERKRLQKSQEWQRRQQLMRQAKWAKIYSKDIKDGPGPDLRTKATKAWQNTLHKVHQLRHTKDFSEV